MPIYCYTNDRGQTIEWLCRIAYIPQKLFCGGMLFLRDLAAEFRGGPKSGSAWNKHYSMGMMVHPDDVAATQKEAIAKGLGHVEFNADGQPHMTSKKFRKKYAKEMYGYVPMNDFY